MIPHLWRPVGVFRAARARRGRLPSGRCSSGQVGLQRAAPKSVPHKDTTRLEGGSVPGARGGARGARGASGAGRGARSVQHVPSLMKMSVLLLSLHSQDISFPRQNQGPTVLFTATVNRLVFRFANACKVHGHIIGARVVQFHAF